MTYKKKTINLIRKGKKVVKEYRKNYTFQSVVPTSAQEVSAANLIDKKNNFKIEIL